jgi:hypothetical protein
MMRYDGIDKCGNSTAIAGTKISVEIDSKDEIIRDDVVGISMQYYGRVCEVRSLWNI